MTIKRGFKKRPYESGNVTLVFALSGVALVGMIGGGIEITRVVDGRAKLQSDRKSTRLNSSHRNTSRMPSSA